MSQQQCGSCKKPVVWATTINHKKMPVESDPEGKIVLVGHQPLAIVVKEGETEYDGMPRYTSHFVTCPNAGKHRKGKS